MNDNRAAAPSVAVIIPTCNGEPWLEDLLSALEQQTLVPGEILVIDSDSTDATRTIARAHGVRLHRIAGSDFDHGGTRTLAATMVSEEILVCMTQDAVPVDTQALEFLVRPFAENTKIAATYGRQVAAPGATLFSEHLRNFNYPDRSEIRCFEDRQRLGFKTIFISNSFAAWRREVLAEQGFFPERLLFGEDTLTVAKLLENGYCVAYVSEAAVFHSHNYSIIQDFRRYFDIGAFHADQAAQLAAFGGPGGAGRSFVRSEMAEIVHRKKFHLLVQSLLRNAGKLMAYNLGKRYNKLPRCWAERLSMNRNWWSSHSRQ